MLYELYHELIKETQFNKKMNILDKIYKIGKPETKKIGWYYNNTKEYTLERITINNETIYKRTITDKNDNKRTMIFKTIPKAFTTHLKTEVI